jgi:excisionase family DNA binding protein
MTTNEQMTLTPEEVMRRARARTDEIFEAVRSRIPADVLAELSKGMADVLRSVEESIPVLQPSTDDIISTGEAAKLLFVSRSHVVKLIEQKTLPLHHITGKNRFLRKADVLAYNAKKQAEAQAWLDTPWLDTQTEDSKPPGL